MIATIVLPLRAYHRYLMAGRMVGAWGEGFSIGEPRASFIQSKKGVPEAGEKTFGGSGAIRDGRGGGGSSWTQRARRKLFR